MDEQQSFFTIIREGLNTKHMKVPPEFHKYLDEEFMMMSWRKAILSCPSNEQWEVTVLKKGNDIYIEDGWAKFLMDNLVAMDEFLLFTYNGENHFQVQIFGKDGCERVNFRQQAQNDTPTSARKKKDMTDPSNNGSLPKAYFSKPQVSPEIEKLAQSFTSDNPYFTHFMTKSNVENPFVMPVATKFARRYISEAVKTIILENSEGKYWEVGVGCIGTPNKRYFQFTRGWEKFVRGNKLKIGDLCIFELIGGNYIRVHIFRSCAPN
ncbi:DNA-binding barrel domain superfamily [Sesbania bispinosa]|nr:DNA-binding barrel domain superfamily [Sesbania bispinosa]